MKLLVHRLAGIVWRYLRLYRAFLSQSLKNEMIYRSNFITLVIMDIGFVTISVILFKVIYGHVTTIAGWTFHQSIILIGTVGIVREMAYLLFRKGFLELGTHIRTGTFDLFMVKPMAPHLHLGFRHISISESFGEALMGVILVTYGMIHIPGVSLLSLLLYLLFLINSLLIYYGFSLIINSVVFWVIKTQELNTIVYFFMETSRYPGDIYRGIGKFIFTFVIPIGIIATVPASVLVGRLGWSMGLTATGIGITFITAGVLIWNKSIEHYSSASGFLYGICHKSKRSAKGL